MLKSPESLEACVKEEGYTLFIEILKGQTPNKHLFLETLDSIKLFLSKREYLKKFKAIPDCFNLDSEYQDLNVSFLQVLAILSFEKDNHDQLKSEAFLKKLEDGDNNIFDKIQTQFDQNKKEKGRGRAFRGGPDAAIRESQDQRTRSVNPSRRDGSLGGAEERRDRSQDHLSNQNEGAIPGGGAAGGNMSRVPIRGTGKGVSRRNRIRENADKDRSEELALAVSIILANLSCDEDFLKILLGVGRWKVVPPKDQQNKQLATSNQPEGGIVPSRDLGGKDQDDGPDDVNFRDIFQKKMSAQKHMLKAGTLQSTEEDKEPLGHYANYDDEQLRGVPQVERITRLFNLLSHGNAYISEQIAILLANVSNSPYFRHIFVTDRCMKSLLKILRASHGDPVAKVSQLAALIVVLNLTSMNEIIVGLENMKFMHTLQEIIKDEELPNVNKSIALLAISNIQTVGKKVMTQINPETKDFAFRVLLNWKQMEKDGEKEGESGEVVKNLVYASLILFYNLILKRVGKSEEINRLIDVITDKILDFEDHQIINVVLELITLFTRKKETSNYIFKQESILNYVFSKLACENQETLRLAALALSRLAARLDDENSDLFIKNLKEFKEFNAVVDNINSQHQKVNEMNSKAEQSEVDDEQQIDSNAGANENSKKTAQASADAA